MNACHLPCSVPLLNIVSNSYAPHELTGSLFSNGENWGSEEERVASKVKPDLKRGRQDLNLGMSCQSLYPFHH